MFVVVWDTMQDNAIRRKIALSARNTSSSKSVAICLKCGNSGHDMFSCRNDYSLNDLKESQCYVCKRLGHLCCVNTDDATPGELSCYKCGQLGHSGLVPNYCGSPEPSPSLYFTAAPMNHVPPFTTAPMNQLYPLTAAPMNQVPPCTAAPMNQEQLMHKNLLQEFAQKSNIALPMYETLNEGQQHAPKFRSRVWVDGVCYTFQSSFSHLKTAEQDAAGLALKCLSKRTQDEAPSLVYEISTFCKSILNEYATKLNLEGPTDDTVQRRGLLPGYKLHR